MSNIKKCHIANGIEVVGNCYNMIQLSAKFQIWCRENYGIDDHTSLAMWLANNPYHSERYFSTHAECLEAATPGFEKIKGIATIDTRSIPDSQICFELITIEL